MSVRKIIVNYDIKGATNDEHLAFKEEMYKDFDFVKPKENENYPITTIILRLHEGDTVQRIANDIEKLFVKKYNISRLLISEIGEIYLL